MADVTKVPFATEAGNYAPASALTPFDVLREEINHLFDDLGFGASRRAPPRHALDATHSGSRDRVFSFHPTADVVEKEGDYEITAELPGLDETDVEVKLVNGILSIRGEKREARETRGKDYYLSERRYGSFVRSFHLPDGVDAEMIQASFAKGVLTVKLPKTAAARSAEKTIPVTSA